MHTLGEKSDARHGIVRDEGTVVGYTNLVPAHGGHPAMAEVVVGPDHRGGGIGTTSSRRRWPRAATVPGCGRTATFPRRKRSRPSWT